MDKLPSEILTQIFKKLHQHQKLELMCVCHHWHAVITKYSLYDTIVIQSRSHFRKLIKSLQNEPSLTTQCLVLENDLGTDFHPIALSYFFPNLRVIYFGKKLRVNQYVGGFHKNNRIEHIYEACERSNSDDSSIMTVDSGFQSTISDNSIYNTSSEDDESSGNESDASISSTRRHRIRRRFANSDTRNITSHLLANQIYPHLKSLAVSIYPISGKEFIHLLVNAPNLTSLTLNQFTITIERLELLHKTLPHLQHLCILQGVVAHGLAVNWPIKPATLVRRAFFKIHCGKLDGKTKLLQYMRRKYTNLVDFTLRNIFNRENLLNMTELDSDFFIDGVLPLLANFGPQLKRLTFRVPLLDETDIMILIKAKYQLEHLGLETSNSTGIIKECLPTLKPLLFLRSLCLYEPECYDGFGFLRPLKHLKELKIYRPMPDHFRINHLLGKLNPQIESLALGYCWLKCDMLHYKVFYALRDLILTKVILSSGIDTFIALFMPSLRNISVHDCLFQDDNFCLPGHQLDSLTVSDHTLCIHECVVVKTFVSERVVFAQSRPLRRQRYFSKHGPAFSSTSSPVFLGPSHIMVPRLVFTLGSVKHVTVSIPRATSPKTHFINQG
ncbi:hypothetical protein K501DRAFT_314443 [Backusella circina FSU 941]|nr:hypothetical protein K501DRAFT_314443 [Backusella circina FSU 941]